MHYLTYTKAVSIVWVLASVALIVLETLKRNSPITFATYAAITVYALWISAVATYRTIKEEKHGEEE